MKTVFTSREIGHIWAQQNQHEGRTANRSASFNGPVFTSYSTPIAAFVAPRDGRQRVVLISSHTYSATTAKQLSYLCQALRNTMRVFRVPDIGHSGGRAHTLRGNDPAYGRARKPVHAANLAHLVAEFEKVCAAELKRNTWYDPARDGGGHSEFASIVNARETAYDYCAAFKLKLPELKEREAIQAIRARRERLEAQRNDPKAAEKRLAIATRAAVRAAERYEENLAKWRRFEGPAPDSEYAALRQSLDGETFETSQGARVSLEDARRFFKAWDTRPAADWHQPGFSVGPFPVRWIAANGDVQIGCHKIKAEEIRAFAEVLS